MAETTLHKRLKDYHDQCFLMDYMTEFSSMKGGNYGGGRGPGNIAWRPKHVTEIRNPADPKSITFLNNFVNPHAQNLVSNIPRTLLERIQPTVELFKVMYDGKKETFVPLPFGDFSARKAETGRVITGNYSNILDSVPGNLAVNLEEFSFEYTGVNPAEVNYYLRAKLVLYCASVDAFFHQHTGKDGTKVSFSDLIKRPRRKSSLTKGGKVHLSHDEGYFRIFIKLSYPRPPKHILEDLKKDYKKEQIADFFEALESSEMSFFLNILKHKVDIISEIPSQPFKVEIDYVAAVETALYSPSANILVPTEASKAKLEEFENNRGSEIYNNYMEQQERIRLYRDGELTRLSMMGDPEIDRLMDVTYKEVMSEANPGPYRGRTRDGRSIGGARTADKAEAASREKHRDSANALLDQAKQTWESTEYHMGPDSGKYKNRSKFIDDFVVASNYYEARQAYANQLKEHGVHPDQLKTEAYTRLLSVLFGAESDDFADRRVYSIDIAGNKLLEWLDRRNLRGDLLEDEEYKKLVREADDGVLGAKEKLQKLRETIAEDGRNFNKRFFESTVKKSIEKGVILSPNSKENKAHLATVGSEADEATGNVKDEKPNILTAQPPSAGVHTIQWFYLGDLIDAALSIIQEEQDKFRLKIPTFNGNKRKTMGNFNIIFGPCTYNNFNLGHEETISMARMPISLKLFNEFWQKRVVKVQRESYPFQQFLKNVLTDLVSNVFTNRCAVTGERLNRVRAAYDHFTVMDNTSQTIDFVMDTRRPADHCPKAFPIPNPARPPQKIWKKDLTQPVGRAWDKSQIMCIYARTNDLGLLKGDKKADVANGILHLELGNTGQAIRDISFTKADIPWYLEAKGERAGIAGNPLELSEPYNVSFTTIGTNVFKPGRHFYLILPHFGMPEAKANSAARILGLGGYFMVNRVSNTFRADRARIDWYSEVEALWVNFAKAKEKVDSQPSLALSWPIDEADEKAYASAVNQQRKRLEEALSPIRDKAIPGQIDRSGMPAQPKPIYFPPGTQPGGTGEVHPGSILSDPQLP